MAQKEQGSSYGSETYIDSTFAIDEFRIDRSVVHIGTTGSAEKDLDRVRAEPIFLYQVD